MFVGKDIICLLALIFWNSLLGKVLRDRCPCRIEIV